MLWGLVSQITGPLLTLNSGTVGKCVFSSLGFWHWEAGSCASAQLILGSELCVCRGKHSYLWMCRRGGWSHWPHLLITCCAQSSVWNVVGSPRVRGLGLPSNGSIWRRRKWNRACSEWRTDQRWCQLSGKVLGRNWVWEWSRYETRAVVPAFQCGQVMRGHGGWLGFSLEIPRGTQVFRGDCSPQGYLPAVAKGYILVFVF